MAAKISLALRWDLIGTGVLALGEKVIPIVPSYMVLVLIGMTRVSSSTELALTIWATALGSTAGALCWYGVGRAVGPVRCATLIARYGRYVRLNDSLWGRFTAAYRRNRFWVTLLGQTIPVVRIYLPVLAGGLRLPSDTFVGATLLGSLVWNMPLLSLGYVLRGGNHDPARVGLTVIGILVTVEAVIVCAIRRRSSPTSATP